MSPEKFAANRIGWEKLCLPQIEIWHQPTGSCLNWQKKVVWTHLTPSALVLLVKAEAHPTVVRHLLAAVDQHMDVIRVVKGLGLAPDDGEGGGDVGRPRGVRELHLVAVDGVAQQLGIHARHPALDVELADKPEYWMIHSLC